MFLIPNFFKLKVTQFFNLDQKWFTNVFHLFIHNVYKPRSLSQIFGPTTWGAPIHLCHLYPNVKPHHNLPKILIRRIHTNSYHFLQTEFKFVKFPQFLEQTERRITLKMIAYERKRKKENIRANKLQENQQKEIPLVSFNLLDLPTSIIIKIITRILAKDILNCRCASKILYNLISDPPFAIHFLSVSPFLSVLQNVGNDIHFVRLGRYGDSAGGSSKTLKEVSTRLIPRIKNVELIGCCNGLVCFWDRTSMGKSLYITNPAMGEFSPLPKPFSDTYVSIKESYWLGYVSEIGCYKVVGVRIRRALLQTNPPKFYEKSEVQVLVVGSDSWKYVGDGMFSLNRKFCVDIVDGCVHWIVDDDVAKGALRLLSLNVMEDRASTFSPPPMLGSKCSFMELGVLGEILSLIECSSDYEHIEIWSMKDYGVASLWTRLLN